MRIVAPPSALLPLYRTRSAPSTPTERTAILRRATLVRDYERHQAILDPPLPIKILSVLTALLTTAGLVIGTIFALRSAGSQPPAD